MLKWREMARDTFFVFIQVICATLRSSVSFLINFLYLMYAYLSYARPFSTYISFMLS